MSVKIRLMRIGAKKRPFFRIVAVDERKKRTGAYLELLGTYNPLTTPHDINLKQDRIDHWIKNGAQLSDGFLRITGQAPQRPPRKPKREKKETSVVRPETSDEPQEVKNITEVVGPASVETETPAPSETVTEAPVVSESSETPDLVPSETVTEVPPEGDLIPEKSK